MLVASHSQHFFGPSTLRKKRKTQIPDSCQVGSGKSILGTSWWMFAVCLVGANGQSTGKLLLATW